MRKFMFLLILVMVFMHTKISVQGEDIQILYKNGTNTPILLNDGQVVTTPAYYEGNKQELRGVWVATVNNIDIGAQTSTSSIGIDHYKKQYIEILDVIQSYNMNAIFFQVRPQSDAFYRSQLNPWSRFLTGTEGKEPGWDVLSWMIEETHKRNIEFHAWFNPYRVINHTSMDKESYLNTLSVNNFAYQNKQFVLDVANPKGGRQLILNPGEQAVQQFIIDTVMEVVNNYNIDGVHFDDYFYPYQGIGTIDHETYLLNNPLNLSVDDWRRENVNRVVKGVRDAINASGKPVQFGISPFGIWANKSHHPLGSNSNGLESYYSIYADSLKWVKEGWLDYISPQIYWDFQNTAAPYAEIVKWWVDAVKDINVNLYIGQALYRYGENGGWQNSDEVPNQILFNQNYDEIKGSIFFNYTQLKRLDNQLLILGREKIKEFYQNPVLLPEYKHKGNVITNVENLDINITRESVNLKWKTHINDKFYAIYRFNNDETISLTDNSSLIKIIFNSNNETINYEDFNVDFSKDYTYVVTNYNYWNNENGIGQVFYQTERYQPTINHIKDIKMNYNTTINFLENITAFDYFGTDITQHVTVDTSLLDTSKLGRYVVTYRVMDSQQRVRTTTINVDVIDYDAPQIFAEDKTIEVNSVNVDYLSGVLALDSYNGDITNYIEVDSSQVLLNKVGHYDLIYSVKDASGNITTKKVVVKVVDTTSPRFTIKDDLFVDVFSTPNYLSGVQAIDHADGDITDKIIVNPSSIHLNKLGVYSIEYIVSDENQNTSVITRQVHVVDRIKPIITFTNNYYIDLNSKEEYFNDLMAIDNYDGDISSQIVIDDSEVNISKAGTYKVYIRVTDSSGNTTNIEEIVIVKNNNLQTFIIPGIILLVLFFIKKK